MSKTIHKPIPDNLPEKIQKSKTLCLYFELHQPFRLNLPSNIDELETELQMELQKEIDNQNIEKKIDFKIDFADFIVGPSGDNPEFLYGNEIIFDKICRVSYLPGLTFWLQILEKLPNLKLTLGLSGTFLEQMESSKFRIEIVEIVKKMLKTGRMELLAETYYHSITSLFENIENPNELEKNEFARQIKLHTSLLQRIFDYTPTSFRNTELIFNHQIGQIVSELDYKVQVVSKPKIGKNGQKPVNLAILKKETKNLEKEEKEIQTKNKLTLALVNFEATMFFFFTHRNDEFKAFFHNYLDSLEVLGTDFEIFGEHNGNSIFDLWENLLTEIDNSWDFVKVSELSTFEQKNWTQNLTQNEQKIDQISEKNIDQNTNKLPIYQDIFTNSTTSWTNSTQNLVSWLGNEHQDKCFVKLQEIYHKIQKLDKSGKLDKINTINTNANSKQTTKNDKFEIQKTQIKTQIWDFFGKLSTSDNFYYMSDLHGEDGKLHAIFNAYPTPLIAFETFWRILNFFEKYLQTLE